MAEGVATRTGAHREFAASGVEGSIGTGPLAAFASEIVAKGGQHAVVGEVADGAGNAVLAVAQEGERITGFEAKGRVQGISAEAPTGPGLGAIVRGLQQEYGFELATGLVPDREHGLLAPAAGRLRLRMRARSHAEGEDEG